MLMFFWLKQVSKTYDISINLNIMANYPLLMFMSLVSDLITNYNLIYLNFNDTIATTFA